ncbi:hypothetical protein [Holdemania massiliensis]|uniref:Uncharacterized protein n=1 Tax=Holdemania massiliensis TaxID=1468449 RepID=A0A6N7SBB1_9FIRM|nr:hypothetical protein [Holdemania massiliensis]MSA72974.1 hypothetical protein [Holdemania massiliensis]MSA91184.1 hypothetical protein [Holdemania massiliensis]MSB80027.1 hypothetical protein [Holdemania massiliensis]MSC34948.1 hypothetical protein [Holdemania massiliensis]MSC41337.1 hypothetical protein [Holdemania massiliensis]
MIGVKLADGWRNSANQFIRAQDSAQQTETEQTGEFLKMTGSDRPLPFTVTGNGLKEPDSQVDYDAYKVFDNNDSTGLNMGSDHRWEGGHRASCWFGGIRIRAKKIILKTGNRVNPANTVSVILHPVEGSEIVVWSASPEANATYTITVPIEKQVEIKGISVNDQSQAYQRIVVKTCQITEWTLIERTSAWRKVLTRWVKKAPEDVEGTLHFAENFYDKYRDYGISLSGKSSCFRSATETWGSGWTNTTDDSGYMYFGTRRIVPKKIVFATGSESNNSWTFYVYGIKEDGSQIQYFAGNVRAWNTRTITITDTTPIKGIRFRQTAAAYNNIQVQYCRITEWEEPGIVTAWQPF